MFRGFFVTASLLGAGVYTYFTAGTFDVDAVMKAQEAKPVTLTSQAYVRRRPEDLSQAIILPTRVPRKNPKHSRAVSQLQDRHLTQAQAIITPTSTQARKAVLKFAEINPQAVAVMLQSELKRVGCYSGPLNGDWGLLSKRAVRRFNKYARTRLSVDKPDGPAVVTVRQHQGKVCPNPCSFGRVRGPDGRCYEQRAIPTTRPLTVRQARISGAVPDSEAFRNFEAPAAGQANSVSGYQGAGAGALNRLPASQARKKSYSRKNVRKARLKRRNLRRSRRARRKRVRRRKSPVFYNAFGF